MHYSECWHFPWGVEEMLGLEFGEYLFQTPLNLKFCMFRISDFCRYGSYHLMQNF
jgi:hypothetical protein